MKRGRPKGSKTNHHFYVETDCKCIEQVFHADGINASYNVYRRKSTQNNWQFYKSAYILERAQEIYDNI
jgi:hypothetical protein